MNSNIQSIRKTITLENLKSIAEKHKSSAFFLEVIALFCFLVFMFGTFFSPIIQDNGSGAMALNSDRKNAVETVDAFLSTANARNFEKSKSYLAGHVSRFLSVQNPKPEDIDLEFNKLFENDPDSKIKYSKSDIVVQRIPGAVICYVKADFYLDTQEDISRSMIYEFRLNDVFQIIHVQKYSEFAKKMNRPAINSSMMLGN